MKSLFSAAKNKCHLKIRQNSALAEYSIFRRVLHRSVYKGQFSAFLHSELYEWCGLEAVRPSKLRDRIKKGYII
jgi:hypothetical protein